MNISLPGTMKSFVDEQVRQRGYGTSSEYLRDLIRRDQDQQHLRGLLLAGAAAPVVQEATPEYFNALRQVPHHEQLHPAPTRIPQASSQAHCRCR